MITKMFLEETKDNILDNYQSRYLVTRLNLKKQIYEVSELSNSVLLFSFKRRTLERIDSEAVSFGYKIKETPGLATDYSGH